MKVVLLCVCVCVCAQVRNTMSLWFTGEELLVSVTEMCSDSGKVPYGLPVEGTFYTYDYL